MAGASSVSFAMNGGDGPHSYTHNSSIQRRAVDNAKALINEAIADNLDMKQLISSSSSNSFRIADFGCSAGPNTFIAVKNITESVKLKFQAHGDLDSEAVEFQVFFNDHVSNDFNTLFKNLPCDGQYFAAGVAGSFHGRLFPKSSLHFAHSSYSLQWLSKAPKELFDKQSPAWNKGRIYYTGAPPEVFEAYSAQFAKDLESFLNARGEELVSGGLMALIVPCYPEGTPPSQFPVNAVIDLLGATLMDMVKMGLVGEDRVDSFNFPRYNPTSHELGNLIQSNVYFSIEKMEPLVRGTINETAPVHQKCILTVRASWEGLIKENFGSEITDEIFDRLSKKVAESAIFSKSGDMQLEEIFVLLKRKVA